MRTIINQTQSAGYNDVMTDIRADDIKYDPWGTVMGYLFNLAEVAYVEFGVILPDFQPSPMLRTRDDISGDGNGILAEVLNGRLTLADIERLFTVLSRFDDWCRLAGRNY